RRRTFHGPVEREPMSADPESPEKECRRLLVQAATPPSGRRTSHEEDAEGPMRARRLEERQSERAPRSHGGGGGARRDEAAPGRSVAPSVICPQWCRSGSTTRSASGAWAAVT